MRIVFTCDRCGLESSRDRAAEITQSWGFVLDVGWEDWPEGWTFRDADGSLMCGKCRGPAEFDDIDQRNSM